MNNFLISAGRGIFLILNFHASACILRHGRKKIILFDFGIDLFDLLRFACPAGSRSVVSTSWFSRGSATPSIHQVVQFLDFSREARLPKLLFSIFQITPFELTTTFAKIVINQRVTRYELTIKCLENSSFFCNFVAQNH